MIRIVAFQIAENIDIRRFQKDYTAALQFNTTSELFYTLEEGKYLYILSYGVVAMAGYDEVKMSEMIDYLQPFTKNYLENRLREEFVIHHNEHDDSFGFDQATLSSIQPAAIRIVMLNVAQSVTLDYYSQQSSILLEETKKYTNELERNGQLKITSKNLTKFIAKTLNVKNRIVDNLYIIGSPDETWEDEYLSKIDKGLRNVFDYKVRFKDLDYQLQIIRENLELFKDLIQHKRSNLLEIIVIILILIEVINLFFEKLF